MKQTALLIACCVVLSTQSAVAQSTTAAADPSGTWTGYMGRNEGERQQITVTLKWDRQSLSGTITGPPSPGEISSGTFEPATGALKFEVVVQDEAKTIVLFEGKLVQDSISGQVALNNQKGTFSITRDAGGASGAPPASSDGAMAPIRRSFAEVSGHITKAAELVPADKYTYRPAPRVRTFGQLIAHITDGYNYYCATARGRKVEWSDAVEKGSTDKASLVQALREATEACYGAHSGTGQAGPLIGNIGHSNLHYGNLVTYIRMLGLVPPSS